MKLNVFYLSFVFLLLSTSLRAQRQPDVTVSFDKKIESILVNPYIGNIIVKQQDAIESYNPETNSIDWKVDKKSLNANTYLDMDAEVKTAVADVVTSVGNPDLDKLLFKKQEEVYFISNSPFVQFTLEDIDVILNSIDGKVVFNSASQGYRVLQSQYMPNERALLLMVINNKMYSCVYYDLETGTQKWISEILPVESFLNSMKAIFSSFINNGEIVQDKVITTSDFIYLSQNGELYKLEKNDGKILWKSDLKITNFDLSRNEKNIITMRNAGNILSSKTALNLLDVSNGQKLWKDDISTKYVSNMEDAGDKILIAHASGFNFYNYSDGKKVWKKDAKGDNIKQVIPIDGDYLYVADKEMNLIDKDGKGKWKKTIEICDNKEDQVYFLDKVDNNRVLYLTDSYANLVDYTSGKKVWKKDIKFDKDRPLLYSYDDKQNVYLAYNNKKLYRIDLNTDNEKKLEPIAKLDKVRSDHTISNVQLFDWGISLVGQGDVIGIASDGNVKYHHMYKEPGGNKRGWLKAGRAALSFATTGNASFITDSGKGGFGISVGNNNGGPYFANIGSPFLDSMEKRFNALKHNDEHAFIINKSEGGGAEIVKVRKSDGVEVDKVAIEGTKPMYDVDSYNDNLYYVNDNELRVYSKK